MEIIELSFRTAQTRAKLLSIRVSQQSRQFGHGRDKRLAKGKVALSSKRLL
jgi:hypothetical protein